MSKLVARTVEKAIFERFGDRVRLFQGDGYWYFGDHDDAPDDALLVTSFPEPSVYTMRLNDLSLEHWVSAYADMRHDLQLSMEDDEFNNLVAKAHAW